MTLVASRQNVYFDFLLYVKINELFSDFVMLGLITVCSLRSVFFILEVSNFKFSWQFLKFPAFLALVFRILTSLSIFSPFSNEPTCSSKFRPWFQSQLHQRFDAIADFLRNFTFVPWWLPDKTLCYQTESLYNCQASSHFSLLPGGKGAASASAPKWRIEIRPSSVA